MVKQKLTLIGHYCSTGGISIHMQRLHELIGQDFEIRIIDESQINDSNASIYNLRRDSKLKYLKFIWRSDIIHIHTSIPLLRFAHCIIGKLFFKHVVLTVHSLSTIKNKFDFLLLKISLGLIDESIFVSAEIGEKLKSKHQLLPAFIPPNLQFEDQLPDEINQLIVKNGHKKIIVSNAFRLNIHNGVDLYGLDLMIELALKIKEKRLPYFIIFVLTNTKFNNELYMRYLNEIDLNGLYDIIKIYPRSLSFVKLITKADLVIRATNTDGDAITIREAISLGVPVLSSDVVKRPKESYLFKNRDKDDLFTKVHQVLKVPIKEFNVPRNEDTLRNQYKQILRK